jgi:hypothetical protein
MQLRAFNGKSEPDVHRRPAQLAKDRPVPNNDLTVWLIPIRTLAVRRIHC